MLYKSMDWFLYDRDPLNPPLPQEDEGTILSGLGAIGLRFSPTAGGLSQMGGIKFFTLLGGGQQALQALTPPTRSSFLFTK